MCYQMFNQSVVAETIERAATETSYRSVAARFKWALGYKVSPSKLWRIATKKQDCSVKDLAAIMNLYNLKPSDVFIESPF